MIHDPGLIFLLGYIAGRGVSVLTNYLRKKNVERR